MKPLFGLLLILLIVIFFYYVSSLKIIEGHGGGGGGGHGGGRGGYGYGYNGIGFGKNFGYRNYGRYSTNWYPYYTPYYSPYSYNSVSTYYPKKNNSSINAYLIIIFILSISLSIVAIYK